MQLCPKIQALSQKVFTIILLYIIPKPKLYPYTFFTIIFSYIFPKSEPRLASRVVWNNLELESVLINPYIMYK